MTHTILLKNGWEVVSSGKSYTAYQLDDTMCIVWGSGSYKVYKVANYEH